MRWSVASDQNYSHDFNGVKCRIQLVGEAIDAYSNCGSAVTTEAMIATSVASRQHAAITM